MRIHGLMLVKDEADVIGETLAAALSWCDAIYVFDNGSSDGTWELVRAMAAADPRLVPFKQDPAPFSQGLRAEIFRQYRPRAVDGDWWTVLDADEFYIDDPHLFLDEVPAPYGEVWSSSFQYYLTDVDIASYEAAPREFLATPVQQRLHYYLNNWSESRFFRHHAGLVWPRNPDGPGRKRPFGLGRAYTERIRLRHYQYRSPEQVQHRLDLRASVVDSYRHEHSDDWLRSVIGDRASEVAATADTADVAERPTMSAPSWRDRIVPASALRYDAGDGALVEEPDALPPLPVDPFRVREWKHRAASARWRLVERLRGRGA